MCNGFLQGGRGECVAEGGMIIVSISSSVYELLCRGQLH